MLKDSVFNQINNSRQAYENTGSMLETEFIGNINQTLYKQEAYEMIYKEQLPESADPEKNYERILKIREEAQKTFNDTLAFADRNKYINFKNSMALVEKCQIGNPEQPKKFFAAALFNYIQQRFDDKYILKFFTATGGTHLDIVHKIDCYFKLYSKETQEELTRATIDITGRKSKDKATADVLLNIKPEEKDLYDPSQGNSSFDKVFFDQKIKEFGEEIIASLIENYQKSKKQ